MLPGQRNVEFLQQTVRTIVNALAHAQEVAHAKYPALTNRIKRKVTFVTSQELLDLYPGKSVKERENLFTKEHGTVFIMQIGGALSDGSKHDGRAPDYDDWSLNGDLLVWSPVLDMAVELSSMGIRVDPETLDKQLTLANADDRREKPFHKALLAGELPQTIGGGIGQSRVCMVILEKAHIGEVQSSLWSPETMNAAEKAGVLLL